MCINSTEIAVNPQIQLLVTSIIGPLVGVVIGGLLTYFTTYYMEKQKQRYEISKSLLEDRKELYLEFLGIFKFNKEINQSEMYILTGKLALLGDEEVVSAIGEIFCQETIDKMKSEDMNTEQIRLTLINRSINEVLPKMRAALGIVNNC